MCTNTYLSTFAQNVGHFGKIRTYVHVCVGIYICMDVLGDLVFNKRALSMSTLFF